MQLILNIVLAMIGLMIIVFAIWSVIACIPFDRDPEKEYQEFKKRLDKMNEADRIAEWAASARLFLAMSRSNGDSVRHTKLE